MKIEYTMGKDGILYPNLTLPEEKYELGAYAMRRKEYLKQHRHGLFSTLVLKGTLNSHLAQTEQEAGEMLLKLTEEMAENEGVTEDLKAEDQIEWLKRMNNIRQRAEEIVNSEIIYS